VLDLLLSQAANGLVLGVLYVLIAVGLSIIFGLLGIVLFFVVLHIARAIGWVHGKIAEGLLVRL